MSVVDSPAEVRLGADFFARGVEDVAPALIGCRLLVDGVGGVIVEVICLRTLYQRNHLDQVLATFGLILFFNEAVRLVWGPAGLDVPLPDFLNSNFEILPGVPYPTYRVMIILTGIAVAVGLYFLVAKTRIGMLIRAGATNREMVGALGVDIKLLYTLIFGLGAALAGLAGVMAGPIFTVETGMGEGILILAFVVIVIGGIGSVRGAFVAALIVGLIDTVGRSFLPDLLGLVLSNQYADTAAPALSSMLIYLLMATILAFRPAGLFPPSNG